jgi:hypothetical protein
LICRTGKFRDSQQSGSISGTATTLALRFSYHIECGITLKTDAVGKLLASKEIMYCIFYSYYLVLLMEAHHTKKEAATSRSGIMALQENLQFNISTYRNFHFKQWHINEF